MYYTRILTIVMLHVAMAQTTNSAASLQHSAITLYI